LKSEIVVVGAGPVGLAFAIGAATLHNAEITLVERQTLVLTRLSNENCSPKAEEYDTRVYALSPGSKTFLTHLGVWQRLPVARLTDVDAMQVWGDDVERGSQIKFEENQPVAHIVEHAALMNALIQSLETRENIHVMAGTSIKSIDTLSNSETRRKITLFDKSDITADLVVGADGARSLVRELAGVSAKKFDYESDGVVANFRAEKPHGGIARQWFLDDTVGDKSVLAYLPLPNQQISIVWSMSKRHADELLLHSAETFAEAVSQAANYPLGKLTPASEVARIGLQKLTAHDWVLPGLALIGDAAHAIHPMAGQGANLGFADARELLNALQNRSALSAIGDLRVLRTYERARREDAASMGAVTHGLRALYLSDTAIAKRVRNQGLNVLNQMPVVKALFMNHAMK
jgi:2-polyprenylphenol 6-hydroxylase